MILDFDFILLKTMFNSTLAEAEHKLVVRLLERIQNLIQSHPIIC